MRAVATQNKRILLFLLSCAGAGKCEFNLTIEGLI